MTALYQNLRKAPLISPATAPTLSLHHSDTTTAPPLPPTPPSPSLFLSRVPVEIRLQIYTHLFSTTPIHLILSKHWLAHVRCHHHIPTSSCLERLPALSIMHRYGLDRDADSDSWRSFEHMSWFLSRTDVAILRSCRQVYAEAVTVLYAPTFHFHDAETWLFFARRLGPRGCAAIRDVRDGLQHRAFKDALLVDPGVETGELWRRGQGEDGGSLGSLGNRGAEMTPATEADKHTWWKAIRSSIRGFCASKFTD